MPQNGSSRNDPGMEGSAGTGKPNGTGPQGEAGSNYDFTSLEPESIPGAEKIPRMEFVPRGMENPSFPEPTKKDLEPFREVSVTPMDYLRTHEERSLFLSHVRFRISSLPFSNTNIFILQAADPPTALPKRMMMMEASRGEFQSI